MTQETVDFFVEGWCLTVQESLGGFEIVVKDPKYFTDRKMILIENKNIENIELPYEYIKYHYTPKEKAKVIICLLELIISEGDEWLQSDMDYVGDKILEKWDNDRKSNLENK